MMFPIQEFKIFLRKLINSMPRRINLILLGLFLILLPPQNAYSAWEVQPGEPVIREVKVDLPQPQLYPVNVTGRALPWVSARSVMIVDVDSKVVLFAKNPDWQLYPASTTKMMTALVAIEHYPLSELITITDLNGTLGQTMRLVLGERLTVESLLYGLLVQSGNDAATVFANHYPGGEKAFVARMNQKAQELHLKETTFKNPSGIEDYQHVSTVHDLAILGAEVVKNPTLARMVATPATTVTDISGKIVHELNNINQLVGRVPGVVGIKTGWTENAGECLVTYIEKDGHRIIIAILGSADRFGETKTIIDWVFGNHQWQEVKFR